MKALFIVAGIVIFFVSIICLIMYFMLQKKIKESPDDKILKIKLAKVDFISRAALFLMAIIFFAFKLFGER